MTTIYDLLIHGLPRVHTDNGRHVTSELCDWETGAEEETDSESVEIVRVISVALLH